jgi:two-component system sensor histidine kinase MprB
VADIVELARGAKAGELVDEVRMDEIAESVAERARARGKGRVAIEVSTEPTVVRGDPERIQRAISNLVDNALKWSPDGGTVEIELSGGWLTVRDHGPGFDVADLPHVFDRFYRAEGSVASGSGLGLAIAREIVQMMDGTVVLESKPGRTVIRVVLGAAPTSVAAAEPASPVFT